MKRHEASIGDLCRRRKVEYDLQMRRERDRSDVVAANAFRALLPQLVKPELKARR